jgi:hypothetical protein
VSNEPDDARIEAELRSLDPAARLVLAALAVVWPGSLSVEEAEEITEVPGARPSLTELEGRGLAAREGNRFSLAPEEQGRKGLLASLDMVDRALRGLIKIAEDGRLTLDDLDAVLGLTRIAAEAGRWSELLRLVEVAETSSRPPAGSRSGPKSSNGASTPRRPSATTRRRGTPSGSSLDSGSAREAACQRRPLRSPPPPWARSVSARGI